MWLTKRWCAWPVEPAIASFWGLSLGPRCGPWLVASHILGSRYCADCTVPRPHGFPSGAPGHALHFQLTASVVTAHRVWHDRVQRQSAACDQLAAGSWKRIGVPETTNIFILRQCRDIYIYMCVYYIYMLFDDISSLFHWFFAPFSGVSSGPKCKCCTSKEDIEHVLPMIGKTHC